MQYILGLLLSVLSFGSPVHIPVQLAGNFGEPRPNHFHGGIDVKTNRAENLGIYSVADGYVSRAIVQEYGFGFALVVAHPNGHSTVYVHLNRFAPQIQAKVREYQYKHRKFNGDIKFRPGEIPVRKGQFIALSGNTGSSQGPHLHLEYQQTKTGILMDPLNALGGILKDNVAPTAYSFKSYPQAGEGVFQHSQDSKVFAFTKGTYKALGKVGFGIFAHDNMDSVYNNYGVRYTELYCDDKLVFRSDVNGIPEHQNPMINIWGDYDHYLKTKIWFLKSFIDPTNKLPILRADAANGIINFNEEREYHLKYVLKDYYGNQSVKEFVVQGERTDIVPVAAPSGSNALLYSRDYSFAFEGARLTVGKNQIPANCLLSPQYMNISQAFSKGYRFSVKSFPLLSAAKLSIRIEKAVPDPNKLFLASRQAVNDSQAVVKYCGGVFENGWLTGNVKELANVYYVYYDNISPTITPMSQNPRNIMFKLIDNESGVSSYEACLDNKFVLFEYGKHREFITCNLEDTPFRKTGQTRTLRIVAIDNRGNRSETTSSIIY
ncbi:M23 family metallopeptidase [Prevotella sp. HUN102]|uniref:M23 family metallopeptidase n=1 Tax=Prevotella sp. HUN102 TaxID=1392486 RepID=UPI000490FA50|nr:M23 family metallopeptidase [Prevotella sp. HUN102]